jgi:hypothetical protein
MPQQCRQDCAPDVIRRVLVPGASRLSWALIYMVDADGLMTALRR